MASYWRIMMQRTCLFLFLGIMTLTGCQKSRESPALLVGKVFPVAMLKTLDGETVVLADYCGKVLVINFWATWCVPCRHEMPELQRLSDRLDSERYRVLGVAVDGDVNLVKEFKLSFGIQFANLIDHQGVIAEGQLQLSGYPQTFILSPGRVVVKQLMGIHEWNGAAMLKTLDEAYNSDPVDSMVSECPAV